MTDPYRIVWPLLRQVDPETAHRRALQALHVSECIPGQLGIQLLERAFAVRDPRLAVNAFGLRFPNPVGLAAGLDKDAHAPGAFAAIGCGFVEIGTVTPLPQPGNPRPRMFRLIEDAGIINRLGFPGVGVERVRARLWKWRDGLPGGAILGINIGKNAATPLEASTADYVAVFDAIYDLAGYVAINVSSPNTQGLRTLQARDALTTIAGAVIARRERARQGSGRRIPVLVKIAPDLDEASLAAVIEACRDTGVDGLIATNTTTDRAGLVSHHRGETGGLSGAPLSNRSRAVLDWLVREAGSSLPIVSVGGIMTAEDARQRLDAGATLVQVYTGMVYAGPALPGAICRALLEQ
ncbi:MAG: quinone-dependent dihydroorotate dehydrogenase [Chloroflexi bacterium]|nr:quinone-dependent dihydroorotate dehydrogenase [Chloroflexota bacterium]